MGKSIAFIKDRAVKTIAAAHELAATWTWQEMTTKQYEDKLSAIVGDKDAAPPVIGQEEKAADAEQAMLEKRGLWDTNLDQLHRWTMQGVGMARTRYRNDPVKLKQVSELRAQADSRSETLREALEWESAWEKVDAAWAPLPVNTLTAFSDLREACAEELQTDYADARANWREAAETLNQLASGLEEVNVAWYADATRVFAEGTAEGENDPRHHPDDLQSAQRPTHPSAGALGIVTDFSDESTDSGLSRYLIAAAAVMGVAIAVWY